MFGRAHVDYQNCVYSQKYLWDLNCIKIDMKIGVSMGLFTNDVSQQYLAHLS